jgi:hypothetical protein
MSKALRLVQSANLFRIVINQAKMSAEVTSTGKSNGISYSGAVTKATRVWAARSFALY